MANDLITSIGIKIDPKRAKSGGKEVENALNKVNKRANSLKNTMASLFAGFSAVAALRSFVRIGDEMSGLQSRLSLVIKEYGDLQTVQEGILKVAQDTSSELTTTTDLYIRLAQALDSTGESSQEILKITETINDAFRISGASTVERTNAIRQLNQGLASGVLRGEEYNAIAEQGVRVTQLLSDALGVEIGELRKLAQEGKLTTDVVIQAFKDQSSVISEEAEKIAPKVSDAFTKLSNIYKTYVAEVNESNGITRKFAGAIDFLSDHLETILGTLGSFVKLLLVLTTGKILARLATGFIFLGTTAFGASAKIAGFTFQMTAMQTVAVAASGTLRVLKTLMGGWLGIALSAVTGLIAFSEATEDVENKTLSLIEANKKLLASKKDLYTSDELNALHATTDAIADITIEQDGLLNSAERWQYIGTFSINERLREITDELELLESQEQELIKTIEIARGTWEEEKTAIENTSQSLKEYAGNALTSIKLFVAQSSAIKTGEKALKDFWKLLNQNNKTVVDWIESTKKEIQSLKERNIELDKGKKALIDYQAKRLKALTDDKKQIDLINKLTKELKGQIDNNNDLIQSEKDKADAKSDTIDNLRTEQEEQDKLNDIYSRYLEQFEPVKSAEIDRDKRLAEYDLLLSKNLITRKQHIVATEDVIARFIDEKHALEGVNKEASKSKGIFAKFFAELKDGFKNAAASIFSGLTGGADISGIFSGGANGFVQGLQGFSDGLMNIASVFEQSGSNLLRTGNTLIGGAASSVLAASAAGVGGLGGLAAIAGPVAIAAIIAGLVDSLSGGKLFGTSFEQTGSGFTGGIGAGGSTGSQSVTEQRQRSFFRGLQTRTTTSALDEALKEAFDAIFDTAVQVAQESARTLNVEVAELVTGSINQNFDADGNLVSSIVTVLGRTYNEGIEEFGRRISAENILAQIAQTVGDVSVTRTTSSGGIDPRNFGDLIGEVGRIDEVVTTTSAIMNEVDAIADRWRHDSELLLDGAQFLLIAQTDLLNGFNLLNDGSLTSVVNLIEDFNRAGESLTDTYVRVVVSTTTFETALELMGVTLKKERLGFIQFAVDITEAAGGLEQAQGLWNSYFSDFFSSTELIVNRLDGLNNDIETMVNDLGGKINFDNFRERFTEILPELSPQEVVSWLQLGEALGDAHELAQALANGGLAEALENYTGLAEEAANANLSLSEQLDRSMVSLRNLVNAYDGSIESEREIAAGLTARYNLELQFIEQIRSASLSITEMINNSIDSIRMSQMTDEERFQFLTDQAEALAASLGSLTDPAEIEAAVAEINQLQSEAFGLLDESQQSQLADGFIEFLEQVGVLAQEQLDGIELDVTSDSDNLISRMSDLLVASQDREDVAIQRFGDSVTRMGEIVNIFGDTAERLRRIEVAVDVRNDVFDDVGNT